MQPHFFDWRCNFEHSDSHPIIVHPIRFVVINCFIARTKIINGKIPTKYTIKKDSKFKILKLSYKDNRNFKTKIPFSLVEINGEELILKTEELSKFSLQI